MSLRRVVVWALHALFLGFALWMVLLRAGRRGDPLVIVVAAVGLAVALHLLDVRGRARRPATDRVSSGSDDDA